MILGIGIDIIEVERIKASHERFGERFLNRILHPNEIAYCLRTRAAPFLAARFAAKEAISKAFGTGIGAQLGWRDMEVGRKPQRQALRDPARRRSETPGGARRPRRAHQPQPYAKLRRRGRHPGRQLKAAEDCRSPRRSARSGAADGAPRGLEGVSPLALWRQPAGWRNLCCAEVFCLASEAKRTIFETPMARPRRIVLSCGALVVVLVILALLGSGSRKGGSLQNYKAPPRPGRETHLRRPRAFTLDQHRHAMTALSNAVSMLGFPTSTPATWK